MASRLICQGSASRDTDVTCVDIEQDMSHQASMAEGFVDRERSTGRDERALPYLVLPSHRRVLARIGRDMILVNEI